MCIGLFGNNGELLFEIQLVATNGELFSISALLDTGFTDGWLAINTQDMEVLSWMLIVGQIEMQTAQGEGEFNLHEGKVIIDGIEFVIPVHVGDNIPNILMGSAWLDIMQLVVNKPKGILTLEMVEGD